MTRWNEIETVLLTHRHEPDLHAARALYASVAAHRLTGAPVWPMLVAPPGAGKTELLEGLFVLPNAQSIDTLTPQTFISGYFEDDKQAAKRTKPDVPAGLLARIGAEGVIVYPDFSTVLGMKNESKASILAQMRRIYDGKLRKEFGVPGDEEERRWEGRITFVVAVTPDIDRYYSIFQTLGERFVMIRWPRAGGVEAALAAMNQDTQTARKDIRNAAQRLFDSLPDANPVISLDIQKAVAAISEIAVRARTHVPREGYKKEIIYVPEAESSTRLSQQLAQLARGSALLDGRAEVNDDDLKLARRVAWDCIPPNRRQVIEAFVSGVPVASLGVPKTTVYYAKQDLAAHGILTQDGEDRFVLSEFTLEHLEMAGVSVEKEQAA